MVSIQTCSFPLRVIEPHGTYFFVPTLERPIESDGEPPFLRISVVSSLAWLCAIAPWREVLPQLRLLGLAYVPTHDALFSSHTVPNSASPPLAFSAFCHGSIALNPADLLLPSCANTVSREGWCKRAVLIRLPGVSSLVFKRWLRSHVLSAYSTAPDGRNTPCSVCVFSLIYNPHPA